MRLLWGTLAFLTLARPIVAELPETHLTFAADMYVGYRNCQKCHTAQSQVLERHPHFTTFRSLHRTPAAKQIANAVGVKSIRRSQRCVRCHYSPEPAGDGGKATSGISCESCHGPARDWITKHNDYGGPAATKESESAIHRRYRIEQSMLAGMRHPSNVYLLARSCFTCHVVDDEGVVEAGHPADSDSFEFVAWSQGSMRHNFYRTAGKHNATSDAKRLRMMFVAGVFAELEFRLRATAKSKRREFATAHARKIVKLQKMLGSLEKATQHRGIGRATELARGIQFKREQLPKLKQIADQLSELAYEFAAKNDGSNLQGVDQFLPNASSYK